MPVPSFSARWGAGVRRAAVAVAGGAGIVPRLPSPGGPAEVAALLADLLRPRPAAGRVRRPAERSRPTQADPRPADGARRAGVALAADAGDDRGSRVGWRPGGRVDGPARSDGDVTTTLDPTPPEPPWLPGQDRARLPAPEIVELVGRAQRGENEAFGVLYDHYVDLVYRYVLYRIGDQTLAEDIVSETFLRALGRISSFTWQGRDIGAWFVTIARNLVLDHVKSSRSRLEFPTGDILAAADIPGAAGPEESVLAGFGRRALLDAVRALAPDQQECVVLRFLEGLSVRETALAMGKREGAVRALQLRAVRALARRLPDDEPA
jgi:RNA polymerase sigma-70 factor, ECF subfamily